MRTMRTGAVIGVALALVAGATSAQALWSATLAGPAVPVRSGDLAITASWPNGAPTWGPLLPGTATADQILRVSSTGAGTTLRWAVGAAATIPAAAQPHVTFAAWIGACGTGTPVGQGWPAAGSFTAGQTVDLCVRASLAAGAPQTLSGAPLIQGVTVTATQRSS